MTNSKSPKPHVVSTRISDDVLAMVDRIAAERERSRAWVLAALIERAASHEAAFIDFIDEGRASIDRGDFVTHEQLLEELQALADQKRAA
ncbi:MAG: hypothetical protein ABL882_03635 [Sphingopyxis sp.]